jgi:hypothetical protein
MVDADIMRARAEEAAVRAEMARSRVLVARGRQSDRMALTERSMTDLHARLAAPARRGRVPDDAAP